MSGCKRIGMDVQRVDNSGCSIWHALVRSSVSDVMQRSWCFWGTSAPPAPHHVASRAPRKNFGKFWNAHDPGCWSASIDQPQPSIRMKPTNVREIVEFNPFSCALPLAHFTAHPRQSTGLGSPAISARSSGREPGGMKSDIKSDLSDRSISSLPGSAVGANPTKHRISGCLDDCPDAQIWHDIGIPSSGSLSVVMRWPEPHLQHRLLGECLCLAPLGLWDRGCGSSDKNPGHALSAKLLATTMRCRPGRVGAISVRGAGTQSPSSPAHPRRPCCGGALAYGAGGPTRAICPAGGG